MKALAPGHAETAAHLAARLRGHAERFAVAVGNDDGLDGAEPGGYSFAPEREEILAGAVTGGEALERLDQSELILLFETFAARLGKVGHPVDGTHTFLVEPCRHLPARKGGKSAFERDVFQLVFRGS